MNFLGMGPMELLLIVVLALIVFGPARLPEIMGQVGKAIGDFRRATSELSDEFNRTIQAELQETRAVVDETKATFSDARASVYDAHAQVNSAITGLPAPVRTADAVPATNGTSTEPYAASVPNGTAPASSLSATPALADTSQWSWETSPAPAPAITPAPRWRWESSPGPEAITSSCDGSPASGAEPARQAPPAPTAEAGHETINPGPPTSPAREHARGELLPPY
jgi:sec-independent protein translocase protein TatB